MAAFIARRLLQAAATVFAVATITFFLIHIAPGDPLTRMTESPLASPEFIEQARRNLGLDRPLHEQYLLYIANLARGDLGVSLSLHRPTWHAIRDAIPNTLILALAALFIDFFAGVLIGTTQGMRPKSRVDDTLSALTLTLYSTPVFWLGLMLLLLFGQELRWLPVGGVSDPVTYPYLSTLGKLLDRLEHLLLPALTLGLIGAAGTARYQRAALIDVIQQDYVRAARAKGLGERAVTFRHALRNALLPTVTLLGLSLPLLLSGAVLVETVFAWPGMGKLSADAVFRRDYTLVTSVAMIAAVMVVLGNLLSDILYRVVDPRTRAEP